MAEENQLFVLDREAMLRLWLSDKVAAGAMSQAEAEALWRRFREDGHNVANYFSTATDVQLMAKLARDLKNPLGRVYFKEYGGKLHVVFKGRAGVRRILTGTRYGVQNAKVVNFAIGRAGIRASAKGGTIVSVFLLTAWNIADYVLRDEATLGQLIGGIASDVTKAAIGGGVGYAAGALMVGTAVGTFALGPILFAVAVGVGVGLALDWLDDRYQLTAKLQKMLDEAIDRMAAELERRRQGVIESGIEAASALAWRLIDLAADAAWDAARRQLNRLVTWRFVPTL